MASNDLERELVQSSAGFQSKEDYKRKREEIEREKALTALKKMADGGVSSQPEAVAAAGADDPPSDSKKKKKRKTAALGGLSFGDDLDAEAAEASPTVGAKKIGKCQEANVSFLELNAREKEEASAKQDVAMRALLEQQAALRDEQITLKYTYRSAVTQKEVTCGYVDGEVLVKRGFTADEVAVAVRNAVEQRGGKFAPIVIGGVREERDVRLCCSCAGMPQGTFTIPGSVTLVELSTRKWADTQQPLFDNFAHGIVVVERRYFEQSKHLVPFNYWRAYESTDEPLWSDYVRTRSLPFNRLEPNRPPPKK